MANKFYNATIRLPVATSGLSFNGPEVARIDPALAGVTYAYHWYQIGTLDTPAVLPGTLAIRTNMDGSEQRTARITNRLVGATPLTYTYALFICEATVSPPPGRTGPLDPSAPYRAQVTFIIGAPPSEPDLLSPGFNALTFRDTDRFRIGIAHDNPTDLYLFMGLPPYAVANQGPIIQGGGAVGQQWLPIENIQEFIPPRITSNRLEIALEEGPNITEFLHSSIPPTEARANRRNIVKYGAASLRLLWKESYASHGGIYGLYQAAINANLFLPFAYYYRDPVAPSKGRVLRSWTGYIAEFVETMTRQGRIVDIVIMPTDAPAVVQVTPTPGRDTIASIVFPEDTGGIR